MKKYLFLCAALVASVMLKAQSTDMQNWKYALPINITLTEFSLDSLRAKNGEAADRLLLDLKALQDKLKKDAEVIKQAQAQLKDEQDLLKRMDDGMKDSKRRLDNMIKILGQEQKEYDAANKSLEKQLDGAHKYVRVNRDARLAFEERLTNEKSVMADAMADAVRRSERLVEAQKKWTLIQESITAYQMEVMQKTTDMNLIENNHKAQVESVKAEVKRVEEVIKMAKKK